MVDDLQSSNPIIVTSNVKRDSCQEETLQSSAHSKPIHSLSSSHLPDTLKQDKDSSIMNAVRIGVEIHRNLSSASVSSENSDSIDNAANLSSVQVPVIHRRRDRDPVTKRRKLIDDDPAVCVSFPFSFRRFFLLV